MPGTPADVQQWCPAELTAAAGPLRRTGTLLQAVADDHRGLERLAASEPEVHAALKDLLERWEVALWGLGEESLRLGQALQNVAASYTALEEGLQRGFLGPLALPDRCP
jgi:hypothetical protein